MMRWTYILAAIGFVIGAIVGLDAAQTVDATAVGGDAAQLWVQKGIFNMYTGWFTTGGIIIGFVIDAIRYYVDEARYSRRYGSYTPHRPVTDKDREAALDAIASRIKRGGSTPNNSNDALVGEVVHHGTIEPDEDFWARVENASKQKPLNWQD